MSEAFVIFPIGLFEDVSLLNKYNNIYLVEEKYYFDRSNIGTPKLKLNILKPIYHRATMKSYEDFLKKKGIKVKYIEVDQDWIKVLKKDKINKISCYDPIDRYVEKKIKQFEEYDMYDTPSFMTTYEELSSYDGKLLQTSFYSWQRKRTGILMKDGKYEGGKLTFDSDNRKSPYKGMENDVPTFKETSSKYLDEAKKYVQKKFNKNNHYHPEETKIIFSIDHAGAKYTVNKFIKESLSKFGDYQDAFVKEQDSSPILFHSGISVMMNIGLITPQYVVDQVLKKYRTNKKVGLNNVEGFIRQILGWREFCRFTYEFHRDKFNNKNHFNNKKSLNRSWYEGTTGLVPVDRCIKRAFKYGYLHHIERLMVMANSMVISEIKPKDMFKWFTEFSLDSYDWVMEYNVYAMGSYSDGGEFTTKPYISSSNYVLKMSDYGKKDNENNWQEQWDLLFWRFMESRKVKIKKINRLGMLLKHAKKNIKENAKILNQ